jgi:folate-binding protein YgfZ
MVNPKIQISNLDVIVIKGKDAEAFLQGQITNDIKLIKDEEKAIYAGYCSPKGRLIAFFLIIKVWDNYFLFCPSSISNGISKKLSMYIMRSEVSLSHLSEDISYFIFHGESKEEEAFRNYEGTLPKNLMQTIKKSNANNKSGLFSVTKLSGRNDRYFVLGNDKAIKDIYTKVYPNQGGLDSNSWHESDIESKIPNIFTETQDKFIPQSLNLDLIDAISFKKGCYTGQEIVARTHYLGKPKRRMYLGSINVGKPPKLGDAVTTDGNKVGQIINFCKKENGLYQILFEILIEKISSKLMMCDTKIVIKVIN